MISGYYNSGAETESSLTNNIDAFNHIRIVPRMLRGYASATSMASPLSALGIRADFPAVVAPMAMQRLAHDEGEIAVVCACAAVGVPYILSTMATTSLADVADAAKRYGLPSGGLWFQLYVLKDRDVVRDLIQTAEILRVQCVNHHSGPQWTHNSSVIVSPTTVIAFPSLPT